MFDLHLDTVLKFIRRCMTNYQVHLKHCPSHASSHNAPELYSTVDMTSVIVINSNFKKAGQCCGMHCINNIGGRNVFEQRNSTFVGRSQVRTS